MQNYGWYLTLKRLAEAGIFNRPDQTPIKSAEMANLYEAFMYLAATTAQENIRA